MMRLWTDLLPENFQHQVELVEAELARCMGQDDEVVKHYDQAIVHARTNGYIHESAIAAELAAEYFLDHLEILGDSILTYRLFVLSGLGGNGEGKGFGRPLSRMASASKETMKNWSVFLIPRKRK